MTASVRDSNSLLLGCIIDAGYDMHDADKAHPEDGPGFPPRSDDTGWKNRGTLPPRRFYLELYRNAIDRVALGILYMDDQLRTFIP